MLQNIFENRCAQWRWIFSVISSIKQENVAPIIYYIFLKLYPFSNVPIFWLKSTDSYKWINNNVFLVPRGLRTSKYTCFCNGGRPWRKNNTKVVDVPRWGSQSTKFGEDFTLFKTFENDCCSSRNQDYIVYPKGENFVSIAIATRYKLHYFLNASLFLLSSVIYGVLHFLLAPFFFQPYWHTHFLYLISRKWFLHISFKHINFHN